MNRQFKRLWRTTAIVGALAGFATAASAQDAPQGALGTAPTDSMAGADPRDAKIVDLQRQLSMLAEEVRAMRTDTTAKIDKVAAAQSSALASMPKVSWKGGPEFSAPDGSSFKVRGRVLVDGVFQNWSPESAADLDTREFRGRQIFLGVEGKIGSKFAYKVEGGWANGSNPVWDDAIFEYRPNANTAIIVGNAKAAGLENITSTRFVTFLERGPYANVAALDYNTGVIARHWGKNWSITGAIQGDSLNSGDVFGEETLSEVGRVTFAPILNDTTKVHIGAWARHRDHGDGSAFSYSPRPNTAYIPGAPYALKGTGAVGDTDNTFGVEGLIIHRRFSVQGEYVHIAYDGLGLAPDGEIDAGYIFGSAFLGGSRTYSVANGEVSRPKIDRPVTDGGMGALELAVRYDFADVQDSTVVGDYSGFTVGANYYPTQYVRFMLNYTAGEQSNPLLGDDIEVQSLQMRAQLDF